MAAWLDLAGGWLLDAALASTAWLGLVALAMVASGQPARRCVLARAGLAGSLLIPPLVAGLPGPRLDLGRVVERFGPSARDEPLWVPPRSRSEPPTGLPGRPGVRRGIVLAYGAGVLIGLAWLALGCWASARLGGRSEPADPETQALYDLLAPGRWRPRLRVSGRVRRPVLTGALRPAIVVPAWLAAPEHRERLRLSLLHELAHAGRLDGPFGLVAGLAQAVWFFSPLAWWTRAQMRLDQEFVADSVAASAFSPCATQYAASLVELAGGRAGPAPDPAGAAVGPPRAAGAASALGLRVLMLVRCPFPVEGRPPGWLRVLAPVSLVLAVLLACLTWRGAPAGWSLPPVRAPHGRLDLAGLSFAPAQPKSSPRSGFPLPLPTPEADFRLTFEVRETRDGPEELEIAGRLVPLPRTLPPQAAPSDRAWRSAIIERRGGVVTAWVDGRPQPSRPSPTPDPFAVFLRIAGAGEVPLRNLSLTW